MIAFLHTSGVHIERFEKLVQKNDSKTPIQHFVNSNLLTSALENNKLDVEGFKKEIETIQQKQPSLIICTCSTYGKLCDEFSNVKRLDYPIVKHIVETYSTIAVAYTANSTALVSRELLEEEAKKQQKKITVIDCNCTAAWKHFIKGSKKYEKKIAKKIKKLPPTIDCVFLAQASMTGVVNLLQEEQIKIYSSPEFGVNFYLNNEL